MRRGPRPAAGASASHDQARLLTRAREQQQKGNLTAAIKHLRKAVKFNPDDVRGYHLLAQVQQQSGLLAECIQTYKACLRRMPEDIEALINLGMLQKHCGEIDAAINTYRNALAVRDDIPELYNNIGNAWLDKGDCKKAVDAYSKAIDLKPGFAGAWHNLGRCYLQQGQPATALEPLRRARRLQADSWQITSDLADCLAQLPLNEPDQEPGDDLLVCLTLQRVDGRALGRAACRYLRQQVFNDLFDQLAANRFRINARVIKRLQHPLVLAVLQREPLCDLELEKLFISVREQLLMSPDLVMHAEYLLGALAEQCFLNEYLWDSSAEEQEQITRLAGDLATAVESSAPLPEVLLCLYACYQPLSTLITANHETGALSARAGDALSRLLYQQVAEPAEETYHRQRLPALTVIDDVTSRAVREQYEDNPYPRWRMIDQPESFTLSDYLCRLFPRLRRRPPHFSAQPGILCAGCGTGLQALRMARRIKSASILAVDISSASLAYGQRQALKNDLQTVRFAQGDILRLDDTVGRFDCIECYGVLHHLADPQAGWRNLRHLLKPGGVMRIGLYSRVARGPIRMIRQIINDHQFTADIESIRKVRRYIAALPDSDPVHGLIHSPDFYTVSECRDLMFHVQEHQLSLPDIASILQKLELEFLGFEFENFSLLSRYQSEFPDDPNGTNLENWHDFENRYPDSFAAQYIFWVQADT